MPEMAVAAPAVTASARSRQAVGRAEAMAAWLLAGPAVVLMWLMLL